MPVYVVTDKIKNAHNDISIVMLNWFGWIWLKWLWEMMSIREFADALLRFGLNLNHSFHLFRESWSCDLWRLHFYYQNVQLITVCLDCSYEFWASDFWNDKEQSRRETVVRDLRDWAHLRVNWWWRLLMKGNDEMGRKNHQRRNSWNIQQSSQFYVYFTIHAV